MNRWLITGATGLLGANAAVNLAGEAVAIPSARRMPRGQQPSFIESDLTSAAERDGLVDRAQADVVFHAAALSSIEACAQDPALAHELNVEASAHLARQAAARGAKFVFISTDAVFNGERGNYSETDETSPNSEYGRTKVRAEAAVLEAHPSAIVARVNFYGWSPTGRRSLAEFFYRELSAGHNVNGFTDTVVSTMYVESLISAIKLLVANRSTGIFHVASSEPTSKYDFGRRLATTFGFDPTLVHAAQSADFLADRRGSQMSLSTAKFTSETQSPLPRQEEDMKRLWSAFESGLPKTITMYANEN